MTGETHERLLSQLASTLGSLAGTTSLGERLCEAGRRMLSADGATITLAASSAPRVPVCATDDLSRRLDELQDIVEQGPAIEAMRTGLVVVDAFGSDDGDRWPLMHEHGAGLSFNGTLLAVPLLVDDRTIGVLSAHRQLPEKPDDHDIGAFLGATLATPLLQDPDLGLHESDFSESWPSRARVHQATGMIVAQVGVHPHDALALLKGQAFMQNATLADVAAQIIDRRIDFRDFTIEGD